MKKGFWIITTLIVLVLSISRVERTEATPWNLADGNYSMTIDFVGTTYDATGTITIQSSLVTSFHVDRLRAKPGDPEATAMLESVGR